MLGSYPPSRLGGQITTGVCAQVSGSAGLTRCQWYGYWNILLASGRTRGGGGQVGECLEKPSKDFKEPQSQRKDECVLHL